MEFIEDCENCKIVYSDEKNDCKNCKKYAECSNANCIKEDNRKCFVAKTWTADEMNEVRY